MKRFVLYLFRWQLSTPILWLVVHRLGASVSATVIANLIGGAIFFWIDKFIFTSRALEVWHIKETGICDKCSKSASVWRLVKTKDYDRSSAKPVFLCYHCSKEKLKELRQKGIKASHLS